MWIALYHEIFGFIPRRFALIGNRLGTFCFRKTSNESFLWGVAQAYFEKRDWNNALLKYKELSEKLETNRTNQKFDPKSIGLGSSPVNLDQSYNLIECQYYIAYCLFSLGRYRDCTLACEKTLDSNFSEQIEKRQKGRLKSIERLLEKSRGYSQVKG